jgi:O-antigen/teichoic acid export membrane protein
MLVVVDLGIGNALINHSANIAAEDNPEKLKKTISGSLGFLFVVSLAMGLFLSICVSILPIEQFIKVKDASIRPEIQQTLQIFAALFGFNLIGSGVHKLLAGLQRTFEGFIASAFCSLLALACIWWAANQQASIPLLLIVTLGVQSLSGYILFALLIKRNLFTFKGIGFEVKNEYKQLIKSGGLFFILQIGVMVGWGADSLIISSTLGAASVAIYSITQRLFQFSSMSIGMLNAPLWGAYADANARKDKNFIRNTLRRSIKMTALFSLLGISIILVFHQQILQLWLGNEIAIPLVFLCVFGFWSFLESMGAAFAIFLNGLHVVKPQVISVILLIAISLPLKFVLIKEYGVIAIPIAIIIAYLIEKIITYGIIYSKTIKKLLV